MLVIQALMCFMLAYDPWGTIPFWFYTKIICLQSTLGKSRKTGVSFTVLGLNIRVISVGVERDVMGKCLRQTNQETHQASEWFRLSAPEKTPLPFGNWSRQLTQFPFVSPFLFLFEHTHLVFLLFFLVFELVEFTVFCCIWREYDWLRSSVLVGQEDNGKDGF